MVDVSVVIATYNRSAQVQEAIDSVLAQTIPVREIIVVDDGSRDDTRAVLEGYGDRIRAFFRPNGGASAARNYGMRAAQGEWIAFLDDDDVWLPNKIESQMKLAERNAGLGLIYCSDYAVDEQLKILYKREALPENRGDVFERLLIRNFIFTSCAIARRDAVKEAGYMDLRYRFAQDWDLWLKIAAKHPADFVPEPLVLYRQSASGCLTRDMKFADRLAEMQAIVEHGIALRTVNARSARKARWEIERQWAAAWLTDGDNRQALTHSLRTVRLQPASPESYRLLAYSLVPSRLRNWAKGVLRGQDGRTGGPQSTAETLKRDSPHKTRNALNPPPVIILNMFYSGLAIARDMAATGIKVIGLSADRSTYGNFTRSCEVRFAPDSQANPEELARYLIDASAELKGAVIFPTRDADVVFLDSHREQLQDYRLCIPPHDVLQRVLDKGQLARAASSAGVPVPRTIVVREEDDLHRVAAEVGFPCVVKPVKAYQWRGAGKWETVGCRKAFRADNPQQLYHEYTQVAQVDREVLVQEWIPGETSEIAILGGYFGSESEPLGYFSARKLLQEPEDFGTGCIVQNAEFRELAEPSVRLCRSLRYSGMAEIEYKRDARSGEYKLIEINTRHWDQHQLAHMSGVNLTRIAYTHLTGHKLDATTTQRAGGKWVAEDALFYYLAEGIYKGKLKWKTLRSQWSGPKMFGIFSWNDPVPFLRYSFGCMIPRMGRMAWSKIRHKGLG